MRPAESVLETRITQNAPVSQLPRSALHPLKGLAAAVMPQHCLLHRLHCCESTLNP